MKAGALDLVCERGATFTKRIHVSNVDESPTDLTNWASVIQVRRRQASPQYLIEMSTTNGKIAHSGNVITVSLTDEETDQLDQGKHVYSLVMSCNMIHGKLLEDPVKVCLLKGYFEVV